MLTVKRKAYKRKSYTRKDGTRVSSTRVSSSTFKIRDRGKKGRTPKSKRWYEPSVTMGWHKEQSATMRRRLALKAHKGDKLVAGRALQALANVTTDRETRAKANADAKYFFGKL